MTHSPHSLFSHLCAHAYFDYSTMLPYKKLARTIIALTASSVSPALSVPTLYVNVYLRTRGPPDVPIPLESVRSGPEARLKNG